MFGRYNSNESVPLQSVSAVGTFRLERLKIIKSLAISGPACLTLSNKRGAGMHTAVPYAHFKVTSRGSLSNVEKRYRFHCFAYQQRTFYDNCLTSNVTRDSLFKIACMYTIGRNRVTSSSWVRFLSGTIFFFLFFTSVRYELTHILKNVRQQVIY